MMHKILERMLAHIPGYPDSAPKEFVESVDQLSDMLDWYSQRTIELAKENKRLKEQMK